MRAEQRLIQAMCRSSMGSARPGELDRIFQEGGIDWEAWEQLLGYHELVWPAYLLLGDFEAQLPKDISASLRSRGLYAVRRANFFWREFLRVCDIFQSAGIPLMPIKGVAFLPDLYAGTFMRPMGDIDVMIPEKDFERAEALLCVAGYAKDLEGLTEHYWRAHSYHVVFLRHDGDRTFRLELHWALDYKRQGRHLLPEVWRRRVELHHEGRPIMLLSPEDALLSLALHARRFGSGLSLKNVFDAALLLRKYSDRFDWEYCLKMCGDHAMHVSLFFLLEQVRFLTGDRAGGEILERLSVGRLRKSIIRRYIRGRTFSATNFLEHKKTYLELHFLLHDQLAEAWAYVLHIPEEQFAKFYGLPVYQPKTRFFYRWRLIYIVLKSLRGIFK